MSISLIKSPPLCQGRTRIMTPDRKWYKDKNKSVMLYTCCEACYENHIKNTDKEADHVEIASNPGTNCDYYFYNTTCDFADCSITINDVRISIVDNMGNRSKLDNSNDPTFLIDSNDYVLVIENLTDNTIKETSMIYLDKIEVNNIDFIPPDDINFTPFIMEIEFDQKDDFTDMDINISKYEQKSVLQMSELSDHVNDTISNSKYKAFLGMCIYECLPENVTNLSFSVKKKDNNNNTGDLFNISI